MINGFGTELIGHLVSHGWAYREAAIPGPIEAILRHHCQTLWAANRFTRAGIGSGADHRLASRIRGDSTFWWQPEHLAPEQVLFWEGLQAIRKHLNRDLFLALNDIELHYAFYPSGAFYKRHLDQFEERNNRRISMVCYLNEFWHEADGGLLRLYPEGAMPVEIVPRGGTIVLFRSDTIPHEVLPTKRSRMAIAIWFRNRPWPLV